MTTTSHIFAAVLAVLLTATAFQQAIVIPAAPTFAAHELA